MTEAAARTLRVIVAAGMALALAGCFRGRLPVRELYRIASPDSVLLATPLAATRAGPAASIAIAPYQTPGIYGRRGIVYRIDRSEYGTYPSREWALPLGVMLGLLTQDVLAARPVSGGRAVFDPGSYAAHDLVWRAFVREFEEVDRGGRVYAAVTLEARLERTTDDAVVWAGTARRERLVPQGTMPEIVAALSAIAAEGVTELADGARAALARSAAPAASSTPR